MKLIELSFKVILSKNILKLKNKLKKNLVLGFIKEVLFQEIQLE